MSKLSRKLYSTIWGKCPRCHQGYLFVNKNPYKIKQWDKMHEQCNHCHLRYELEPGFFQGAMYVSYALAVALSVGIFIITFLFAGFDPVVFLLSNSLGLILLAPILFRFSRGLYLNFFIAFRK